MGIEVLLIVLVVFVTRAAPLSRRVKMVLVLGYFGTVIAVWSITWQFPYQPNALVIDTVSLALPFLFWLAAYFLARLLAGKGRGGLAAK